MPTKVFDYSAREPARDNLIRQQMRLSHIYFNELVDLENDRRRKAWGGDEPPPSPHPPTVTGDEKGNEKLLYCKCDKCVAHWQAVCQAVRDAPWPDQKPARKKARMFGLYNGGYQLVDRAWDAARKDTRPWLLLHHRSWRSHGGQTGMQIRDHDLIDNYVRLEKAPPRPGSKGGKRHNYPHLFQLRVGSNYDNSPVFCDPIEVTLHRPIQGVITWVTVTMKHVANREVWSVAFTCAAVPARRDLADTGRVAIDVSWRKINSNLRVAFARDDAGKEHELTLGPEWFELGARADRIRETRDNRLNELMAADPRFAGLKSCLSVRRRARELGAAQEPAIVEWLKRELHLWQYECGCRRRSVAVRRDALRVWLRDLRRQYGRVVIKDTEHKRIKEENKLPSKKARRQGHHAAPGEVIEWICMVWDRDTLVDVVDDTNTTNHCPVCDHTNNYGAELMVKCERCGEIDDRDRVSTRNMLALAKVLKVKKPTARKKVSKWVKRHK